MDTKLRTKIRERTVWPGFKKGDLRMNGWTNDGPSALLLWIIAAATAVAVVAAGLAASAPQ